MKTRQIFQEPSGMDGCGVILRTSKRKDLNDMLKLINSLVDEGAKKYREGFEARAVKTGIIPKKYLKESKYIDEVIMTRLLE